MANLNNTPKIRITRKERKSGQIDKSKLPPTRTKVVQLNKSVKEEPAQMQFKHGSESRGYEKRDVRTGDPNYGKESSTNPTPDFVKKAQAARAEYAEKNNKSYAAGKATVTKKPDTHSVKIKINPDLAMHKPVANKTDERGAGKGNLNQKFSKPSKRLIKRVPWLPGQNRKTESGYGG